MPTGPSATMPNDPALTPLARACGPPHRPQADPDNNKKQEASDGSASAWDLANFNDVNSGEFMFHRRTFVVASRLISTLALFAISHLALAAQPVILLSTVSGNTLTITGRL